MDIISILCLSSADSLGKIDKHSLSQQTIMELFIANMTEGTEQMCGSTQNPKDISDWIGLNFNGTNEVIEIIWFGRGLRGRVSWQWVPLCVEKVDLMLNGLCGTVDLTCLPDSLQWLSVSSNLFDGTVDLTHLPKRMMSLNLALNDFHGKTDFSQIPQSLRHLDVSGTKLEGEIRGFEGNLVTYPSYVKVLTTPL